MLKLAWGSVRRTAHTSENWSLGRMWMEAELEGRRNLGHPPPPPALTSHPEASGKGKSMDSRSTGAPGLGLEFDPRTVFTDLKMDRFKWAHLYLERKWGSRDQDKATFYSLKIYHHHHCHRRLPPTVPARSREARAWVTSSPKVCSERSTNREFMSSQKTKKVIPEYLTFTLLLISILFSPPCSLQILTKFKGSGIRSNFRVSMRWNTLDGAILS